MCGLICRSAIDESVGTGRDRTVSLADITNDTFVAALDISILTGAVMLMLRDVLFKETPRTRFFPPKM